MPFRFFSLCARETAAGYSGRRFVLCVTLFRFPGFDAHVEAVQQQGGAGADCQEGQVDQALACLLYTSEMLLDIDEFKRNPSIHFEYKYFKDETPTRFVEAITCLLYTSRCV